jgi:hypothetical protein
VLLLVTGAGGTGKSTARHYVEAELGDVVHVGPAPQPTHFTHLGRASHKAGLV